MDIRRPLQFGKQNKSIAIDLSSSIHIQIDVANIQQLISTRQRVLTK